MMYLIIKFAFGPLVATNIITRLLIIHIQMQVSIMQIIKLFANWPALKPCSY